MTVTVLLIRHAAHDRLGKVLCGRMAGVTLGAAGHAQAARLASALKREAIAAVYSSPLERARETAAPLALAAGLGVKTEAALDEIDVGAWTGAHFEVLDGDPEWRRWNRLRAQARPPASADKPGESMLEAQVRVVGLLERLRDAPPGETVAAVSHADVIKAALCWALALPLDLHDRFEVSPASVSRVVIGDWGAKVWSINEAAAWA